MRSAAVLLIASSLFVVSVGAAERVADHLASGPKTPDQLAAAKRPIRGHRRKPVSVLCA